jgi:hypothetical protein
MLNPTETMNLTTEDLAIINSRREDYQTLIGGTPVTAPTANVLVVFDSCVQELDLLYDAIVPGAVGYTIDAQDDALTEITRLLTQTGARRLAIVAHGEPGVVHLGANSLNREQLQAKAQLLQEWGVEEIALYSCEVGQDVGFVAELERLTGASVAAATGKVGSAALGGSWNLDQQVSVPIFDVDAIKAYSNTLALNNVTYSSGTDTTFNATEASNVTITGTITQGGNSGSDVLIGVYSSM